MKRPIVFIGIVIGLTACFALIRSEVAPQAVEQVVRTSVRAIGDGIDVQFGSAEVQLFPRLLVAFHDVRLERSDGTGPLATIDKMTARVDVLPLFVGRLSISDFILDHPRVSLQSGFDLASATPDPAVLRRLVPTPVTVHRGDLRLTTPDGQRVERLEAIEARLRWPRLEGGASLEARASWRGEAVAVSVQGMSPYRLATGATGDLDVSISTRSLQFAYAGKMALSDRLQLDGSVTASTDDIGRLGELAGLARPSSQPSEPKVQTADANPDPCLWSIEGRWRSYGWTATLADLHLKSEASSADGVLSVRLDTPRPQIQGTLAIDHIDLTDRLAALWRDDWRSWHIPAELMSALEVDLRVSVGEATAGILKLQGAAASLMVTDGHFHAEIGDAALLGGTGSIILRGSSGAAGLKIYGRSTLVGTNVPALLAVVGAADVPVTAGMASAVVEVESEGETPGELLGALRGRATADVQTLKLAKALTIAAITRQLQDESIGSDPVATIDRAQAEIALSPRAISVRQMAAQFGGLTVRLAGSICCGPEELRLEGEATAARPAEAPVLTGPRRYVPLAISGSRDHPQATIGDAKMTTDPLTPLSFDPVSGRP